MNKIIKKQLEQLELEFEDDTTEILVPMKVVGDTKPNELLVGKCYLIRLAPYIINPPDGFTLASNWNKGINPTSEYLNVCITKIVGKMIQVDGVGFNTQTKETLSDAYSGLWLPRKGITLIKEI